MAWVHLVHGNSVVLEGKYCESDLQSQASSEGESAEKPKLSFLAPFVDKVKKMGCDPGGQRLARGADGALSRRLFP